MKRLPKRRTAMNKTSKLRASLLAGVLAVVAQSPVIQAQDAGVLGQMNVPFAFEVASQHFTAGVYKVRMANDYVLIVQGKSGAGMVMTTVDNDREPAAKSKATFRKYGDQYFLGDISTAGKSRHLHFAVSKTEGEMRIGTKIAPAGTELAILQVSPVDK
jgi:hypothetical protein